jgi:hypothetical protein
VPNTSDTADKPTVDLADMSTDLRALEHRLKSQTDIAVGDYAVYSDTKPFLEFSRRLGTDAKDTGWKFHVSVSPEDRQKAFEIILDEATKGKLGAFKVANEGTTASMADSEFIQRGKMFTLYYRGEGNFHELANNIDVRLEAAGVSPSEPVLNDMPVKGSRYMYYRNELDQAGEYVSAKTIAELPAEQRYNPGGRPDPFRKFDLSNASLYEYPPDNALDAKIMKSTPQQLARLFAAVFDEEDPAVRKSMIIEAVKDKFATGAVVNLPTNRAKSVGFTGNATELARMESLLWEQQINTARITVDGKPALRIVSASMDAFSEAIANNPEMIKQVKTAPRVGFVASDWKSLSSEPQKQLRLPRQQPGFGPKGPIGFTGDRDLDGLPIDHGFVAELNTRAQPLIVTTDAPAGRTQPLSSTVTTPPIDSKPPLLADTSAITPRVDEAPGMSRASAGGNAAAALSGASRIMNSGDSAAEKVVGGFEIPTSAGAAALEAAGKLKSAGIVGTAISVGDGAYEVGKTTVQALKTGQGGRQVAELALDKTADVGTTVVANIATAGIAGGATHVLSEREKEKTSEYKALGAKAADMLTGKQALDVKGLTGDLVEIQKKNAVAEVKALEQTTPIQTAEKVYALGVEATGAQRINATVSHFYTPEIRPELTVGADGKPSLKGYKNLQMAIEFPGAKDLSSDPKLAAQGIINGHDPEWLEHQAKAKITLLEAAPNKKGLWDRLSGAPSDNDLALQHAKSVLAELPDYKQKFDSYIDSKLSADPGTRSARATISGDPTMLAAASLTKLTDKNPQAPSRASVTVALTPQTLTR